MRRPLKIASFFVLLLVEGKGFQNAFDEKGGDVLKERKVTVLLLEELLRQAKNGSEADRERLLERYKPFVYKAACRITRRTLEWGRDDELGVALTAFNEAIDRYEEDKGKNFLEFARLVMHSRLTDYLRREYRVKSKNVPLAASLEGSVGSLLERCQAWEVYNARVSAWEREEEIKEYEVLLKQFGITFAELVSCSPRHRRSRAAMIKVAQELVNQPHLFQMLEQKKKLPLQELAMLTGLKRKVLERGRKYIIAIALILHHRNDFAHVFSYLSLEEGGMRDGKRHDC